MDPNARVRDHAYHAYPKSKLGRSIRTERYRLVEWKPARAGSAVAEYELYDYETDPLETRNLATEHTSVVNELQSILAMYPKPRTRTSKTPSKGKKKGKN